MKVLITGVTGFLGSNLVKFLSGYYQIIGIKGPSSDIFFEIPNCKIYNYDEVIDCTEIPDMIVMCHAAVASGNLTKNSESLFNGNIAFTEKILDKFPTAKCIFVSSVSLFGQNLETVQENTKINPITEYAISKLGAEKIVLSRRNVSIVRFSSLYGIGMKENTLIPTYINQALLHQKIKIWGNGLRFQNYLHISDAVALIKSIIEVSKFTQEIFLGTYTKEYSNTEIAEIIIAETGAEIEYVNEDNSISARYNNKKTQIDLAWLPNKGLTEGIREYIQWKRKQF